MRIVDVREKTVSIASAMANAYIDFSKMTCSVVAVVTDVVREGKRVVGYGFNSNGRYGQGALMRERFFPRLMAAGDRVADASGENVDPMAVWKVLMANEKPGGHGERSVAVGTIDMAVWDAAAKIAGVPLYRMLAERYGDGAASDEKVWVYAAGGYYYPGKDLGALQAEMRGYWEMGYRVVKMKIGNGLEEDLARIEAVLEVVGSGEHLAVDANGRFDRETALKYAEALKPYKLFWYEEAGDPLDYALQAEVSQAYPYAMATGENLFSHQDARNLLRYGGMHKERDYVQFDCALSYGLVEYLRTLSVMKEMGWSTRRVVPHGGHQMSLNIAAGLHLGGNESYPGVFQPFGGFADGVPVEEGYVRLPEVPGVGFEAKGELYRLMKGLGET